jgi:ribosomal protein L29
MKKEEKNTILGEIASLKKELMFMRVKASSGEAVLVKDYKLKKKEIARLFTKINNKKAVA